MTSNSKNYRIILRWIIPRRIRLIIWGIIPKIHKINTYLIIKPSPINNLALINSNFTIKRITSNDIMKLKQAYSFMGPQAYIRKVPPRLKSKAWIGLAVFDISNGEIAYISWVIKESIEYFEEFNIKLKENQFLLKDGFCVPHYRHQGLHSRMEQERINYCVNHGATDIYIQILDDNEKGKSSVINNGYKFYQQNRILSWPIYNINRELYSVLRNPFKKVVK